MLVEPVADDRLDEVVADQLAGRHDPPHLGAELGVVLHVPAEDVADADVHEVEVARPAAAWVPLPLPWTPMITYLRTVSRMAQRMLRCQPAVDLTRRRGRA